MTVSFELFIGPVILLRADSRIVKSGFKNDRSEYGRRLLLDNRELVLPLLSEHSLTAAAEEPWHSIDVFVSKSYYKLAGVFWTYISRSQNSKRRIGDLETRKFT